MNEKEEEIARQREIVKRNRRVPYALMAEAVEHFTKEYDVDRVRPGLYGDRIYCELWKDGRAKVVFY